MCFNVEEESKTNQKINNSLKSDAKYASKLNSLLLLGTGESGKSTILKQFKILHLDGFSNEEMEDFRRDIRVNVMQSIIALSRSVRTEVPPTLQEDVEMFCRMSEYETVLDPTLGKKVSRLWHDAAMQKAYENRGALQLQSNASYLLNSAERIASPDYTPTPEDILCSRVRTTGIVEITFNIDNTNFRVLDVGGQRSERRKWLHCFEGMNALMFVIAMDEYDMMLYEDSTTNRMRESMLLFEEIVNSRMFEKTAVILFLNKKDLFREKLARVPLSKYFPDYKGGADYDEGCKFIQSTYLGLNHSKKQIYPHFTCATDTKNIQAVFDDVRHSALMATLSTAGVM